MKILIVSISSIHTFRWMRQLKDSGHEICFFDVNDGAALPKDLSWVQQYTGWKYRVNYPGKVRIKKNFRWLHRMISRYNEVSIQSKFASILEEEQPDLVHSFIMYWCTYPILEVMKNYPQMKWCYSSWGSDLYYHKTLPESLDNIKSCLPFIHFLITDNTRDVRIARELGFSGQLAAVVPGGGGYDLDSLELYKKPLLERRTILIKGYQNRHGQCNMVLDAITNLRHLLKGYNVVVYATDSESEAHIYELGLNSWNNFMFHRHIAQKDLLELMGQSLMHIGNSMSDGMPNTLLESVLMGAFPIQSNPGGATEDIIKHKKNGLLIEDPMDSQAITELISMALLDENMLESGIDYNRQFIMTYLDRQLISHKVTKVYNCFFGTETEVTLPMLYLSTLNTI